MELKKSNIGPFSWDDVSRVSRTPGATNRTGKVPTEAPSVALPTRGTVGGGTKRGSRSRDPGKKENEQTDSGISFCFDKEKLEDKRILRHTEKFLG